ncbi:methyltransferase [Nonomuraea basaltis]|uniref:methyltransferase n=1 Tax=Nonomuraea basaltis TaxID=2495887 RepID=UPI00110C5E80|nr:methyltransferase [Nonomuraea basaltis]TMR97320.1 hypothetical protein EJK15_18790 [Nonomuraea basaltis]
MTTHHPIGQAPTDPGTSADQKPDPPRLPHRDRSRAYFARTAADLDIDPFDLVQLLIDSVPDVAALHAAVHLEVFEQLADQEMTSDELAQACEAHPGAMRRLLRWLHASEFIACSRGRYQLTDLGRVLTRDAERSQRHAVLVTGSSYWWEMAGNLAETVRRGHPAPANGLAPYRYLAQRPALGEEFDRFMLARSAAVGRDLAALDDWAHVRTVADLGGGMGGVLDALLDAFPHLDGILADRTDVLDRAQEYLTEGGLAGRVKLAPGDLFEAVPQGAQRYLLSSVLHNHGDDDCIDLLARVRDAMEDAGGAELLIVEGMLPRVAGVPSRWYATDIRMMTLFRGGQVRTEDDYHRLTRQAGLRIRRSLALPSGQTLLIVQLDPPPPPEEEVR